ncbi:MAG: Ig-like domain-containing protein [Sandaracinaceae bacterium]|nr:Ig-like domain-containing protein [Sandaracinaceae bacterium]
MRNASLLYAGALLGALIGCDSRPVVMEDGGPPDSGADGGTTPGDAGMDGGTPMDDGGLDGGPDGGTPPADGGPIGGGAATSAQIQAVRDLLPAMQDMPDAIDPALAIDDAVVTYVKPLTGNDAAGFFLQAEPMGPAIFVQIDPATLAPPPAAGDVVSLEATEITNVEGRAHVTAIGGGTFTVGSTGHDVSFLEQDVGAAADLHSNVAAYESELIRISGTIAADFGFSGLDHEAAQIDTAGITGEANLLFRLPETLRDSLDLAQGCEITGVGPLWRFANEAGTTLRTQPSVYYEGDVTITSCPAPTVVSAVATSPTQVEVRFDRRIDMASITDAATQFTLDGGLTVSAATVAGRTVTLTTSTQTGGTTYTVTVAASVTDTRGVGVDTPNNATFTGYEPPAGVVINELNANIGAPATSCDLVELRVVSGGTMAGYTLLERISTVLTFPAGFRVATNDVIVIHFDRPNMTCAGGAAAPPDETTAPNAQPQSSVSTNYDTAYDFYIADTGITNTDNVIQVRDATGAILDAVLVSDDPAGTAAGDSETAAADVAAAGEWTMVGGGIPAGGFVDADFNMHAAQDLNGTGTTAAGASIQRNTNTDSNTLSDWTQAASSWGVINTGQSAL